MAFCSASSPLCANRSSCPSEAVPTSPKGASNFYSKGEGQVKGAGSFKNAPAQNNADLEKAPAPSKSQASGTNTKSPVAESRKPVKRIIK